MKIRITIQSLDNGRDIWRNYEVDEPTDNTDWTKEINEIIDNLRDEDVEF